MFIRKFQFLVRLCCVLWLLSAGKLLSLHAGEARMDVLPLTSKVLKNNPLRDPTLRRLAVFLPAQATNGTRLPVIYYLPGFGNSSESFIQNPKPWVKFIQSVADEITPLVLVVVDGRTRWGGSQYLNSPAQGEYENYVCDEIVAAVEGQHPAPTNGVRRIIAGHSSGGFGALRLGISRQNVFDAIIALSPDSDFPDSHLPLVKIAAITNAPLAEIEKIAGKSSVPEDGDLIYALALSAAYAPRGSDHPGEFEWLYDAHGNFRQEIWQRWLANDPLTIVRKNPEAFAARQAVYLDGAAHDEYQANVGAEKIFVVLQARPARCTFYEPPGHHSDHVRERLQRGLEWVYHRPLTDIH